MTVYDVNHSDLARMIWNSSLTATPSGAARMKWMEDVRVGDLVVELSSWSSSNKDDRMGRLIKLGDETVEGGGTDRFLDDRLGARRDAME